MNFKERLSAAWRAFQGDRWSDPKYVDECNQEMGAGAMAAVQRLLDSGGIPRGTFADEQVQNLVALYNQRGTRIAELETALANVH